MMMALTVWSVSFAQDEAGADEVSPIEMAQLFNYFGSYDLALQFAYEAIDANPADAEGYMVAAMALKNKGETAKARIMLEKALPLIKKDKTRLADCYRLIGDTYSEEGNDAEALKAINKGLKIDKKNSGLLLDKADLLAASNWKEAEKCLREAEKAAPDDPKVFARGAFLMMEHGDNTAAMQEINKAIALDDSSGTLYYIRALVNGDRGNDAAAIRDCVKALDADDGDNEWAFQHLNQLDNIADIRLAISELEKAAQSNPYVSIPLANLLYNNGSFLDAAIHYRRVIEAGLDDADTYLFLGKSLENTEGSVAKYSALKEGLDKYPDDKSLKLELADLSTNLGKYTDAIELLDSVLQEDPTSYRALLLKGETLLDAGRYREAIEPLSWLAREYDAPDVHLPLLYAYYLSGDSAGTRSEANALLSLGEDVMRDFGYVPEFYEGIANAALGRKFNALNKMEELYASDRSLAQSGKAMVYVLSGENPKAIDIIRELLDSDEISTTDLLRSYYYHPLHHEQSYIDMLKERGTPITTDPESGLILVSFDDLMRSPGGTSWKTAMETIDRDSEDWVKSINDLCPIDMGPMGQLTSVRLNEKEKTIIFNYTVVPEVMNIQIFRENPEFAMRGRNIMGMQLLSEYPVLIESGCSMVWHYEYPDNSMSYDIELSAEEMRELARISKSQDEIDDMMIDYYLELTNINSSDSLTAHIDKNDFVIVEMLGEEDPDLSTFDIYYDATKEYIKNMIRIPSETKYFKALVRRGMGIRYEIGKPGTDRTVTFRFSPDEIREILGV